MTDFKIGDRVHVEYDAVVVDVFSDFLSVDRGGYGGLHTAQLEDATLIVPPEVVHADTAK